MTLDQQPWDGLRLTPRRHVGRCGARVGARGFSAYVAQAVARQLERDALDDALARMEAEHGPVDENEVLEIMGRLAG